MGIPTIQVFGGGLYGGRRFVSCKLSEVEDKRQFAILGKSLVDRCVHSLKVFFCQLAFAG